MQIARLKSVDLNWREDGHPNGFPVVFANSLGTDFRLWDDVVGLLPLSELRIIRFDKRGHGLSSCPDAPYSMEDLVSDTEQLLDHTGIGSCVFIGLSIGGMIGQLLAHRRPQRVRGLVLSNTAARMGTRAMWQDRILRIRSGGMESIADTMMERWFSGSFRRKEACLAWRHMLTRTPVEGYIGCSEAIARTDLTPLTSGLRLPVLGIGGSDDPGSPSAVVRATAELVPGARYVEIAEAGHLPCVEHPDVYAGHLINFLKENVHVGTV